jgi:hypothetical protein
MVLPVSVFDPMPADAGATMTCRIQDAIGAGDAGAGLDYDGTSPWLLAGQLVTGCVAAQFDGALGMVTIRMRAVGNACSWACRGPSCGTGDHVLIFVGSDMAHVVAQASDASVGWGITSDFADYTVPMNKADHIVIVCRSPEGPDRDDVEVDSIVGTCFGS